MRSKVLAALSAVVLTVGIAVIAPPGAGASGSQLPVTYSSVSAIGASLVNSGGSPPGSNDWSCKPSAAHPRPVVLVHATFANQALNWNALSPLLKNNGYCVFSFNYGGPLFLGQLGGYGSVAASAGTLNTFVDQVRAATGVSKVDLVGHSQGGMMPRYYLKFLGGASKVQNLVGLAPSNHGTTLFGLTSLLKLIPGLNNAILSICQSCTDQIAGSAFMQQLNGGGDTVPGVTYTVIETKYDEVVTPYKSAFLSGPNVHNITLQDQCWVDFSEHLAVAFDHIALRDVLNALDPAHAVAPTCSFVAPVIGG